MQLDIGRVFYMADVEVLPDLVCRDTRQRDGSAAA
jgi:hypothetical protein